MKAATFQTLVQMFPQSPVDATTLPDKLPSGKVMTYTARIGQEEINKIIIYCTGEDPSDKKYTRKKAPEVPKNWKNQIVYDEQGDKVYDPDSGTRKVLRRWEPIHFVNNRKPGLAHIRSLTGRFSRAGYQSSLRKIVFSQDGWLMDGQQSLIALWHLLNDYGVAHVDICVEFNSKDDPQTLFRLFDQALRRRSLKDALTTVPGLPEGFETELAGTLRFAVLLASGKGLASSRLTLPHITNELGKEQKLEPDDIANMINPGEPFEYVSDVIHEILGYSEIEIQSDDSEESVPLITHRNVSGPGMPNAQYWLTAFLNAYNSTSGQVGVKTFISFLQEVVKGGDSDHKSITKLVAYRPEKVRDWLPAIEHCLSCFANDVDPKRAMPKALTFNGIQSAYDEWLSMYSDSEEEYEEEEVEVIEETPSGEEVEYEDEVEYLEV